MGRVNLLGRSIVGGWYVCEVGEEQSTPYPPLAYTAQRRNSIVADLTHHRTLRFHKFLCIANVYHNYTEQLVVLSRIFHPDTLDFYQASGYTYYQASELPNNGSQNYSYR